MEQEEAVKDICAALERDQRTNLHHAQVRVESHEGRIRLVGEVEDIVEKRAAVDIAAAVVGLERVEDRLEVRPGQRREDGAIGDGVKMALLSEPVFYEFSVAIWNKGRGEVLREPSDPKGRIDFAVKEGVVTLSGHAWSLSHRRLASLLAWWVPGVRNVVNRMEVRPAETDNDGEINDGVVLALEKDPLVHASQIRVTTRMGRVMLEGFVATDEERRMAEFDAWYLDPAVRDVANRIEVRAKTEGGHYPR